MRVDWAIPCRFVEVQQPYGATIVGAGADVAIAPALPSPVQVLFAVRYIGAPDELDGESRHPFVCRIFRPDGSEAGRQTGHLTAEAEMRIPGYVAEMIVPVGVVIDAQEFGTYGVEFGVDEHAIRVPIHIIPPPDVHTG